MVMAANNVEPSGNVVQLEARIGGGFKMVLLRRDSDWVWVTRKTRL